MMRMGSDGMGRAAEAAPPAGLALDVAALGRLMPLHLRVGPGGHLRGAGPTLAKLLPADAMGRPLLEVFDVTRPRGLVPPETGGGGAWAPNLGLLTGARLKLALKAPPNTGFKGLAVPLDAGEGWLLNLSFGIGVAEAVREHRLTDADFAATDLAIEMLYLLEAKSAVLDELRRLNLSLHNAKTAAEEEAMTDTLTGLRNRRAMDAALATLTASGTPFGLMHVDLDFFKQVNDTLGHAAGDHVLTEVARILTEETRGGDTVARVGGDEFVLLFPGLSDPQVLERIGERILARIEQPMRHEGQPCRVSASIGLTVAGPGISPDRLLSDADRALYASKRGGRGRVTRFSPDLSPLGEAPGNAA